MYQLNLMSHKYNYLEETDKLQLANLFNSKIGKVKKKAKLYFFLSVNFN